MAHHDGVIPGAVAVGTDVDDRAAMDHALALAERARGRVSPNPPVGCVIVADGSLVGQGWTQPPPGGHAEAVAVAEAGDAARGGTAYVTLEPCGHTGRTPPCVDALTGAGVARVVYAAPDPSPLARGGAARLREAGVDVVHDATAMPVATRQLAAHLHAVRAGRPLVVIKLAVSLDGRVAAADGTSQWLTGTGARERAHRARAQADAVMVGVGTALADDPQLTVRLPGWDGPQPLRVVCDGNARTPPSAALADTAHAATLVVVRADADPARCDALRRAGVDVVVIDARRDEGEDLRTLLDLLMARDVREVLVEGGATLAGAMVGAGLVDRLEVHLAATLLGDHGLPALRGLPVASVDEAPRFALDEIERVDDDVVLTYVPRDDQERTR